ncbi:MAG: hypothetical protein ACREDM_00620 [Methylocella sp.]
MRAIDEPCDERIELSRHAGLGAPFEAALTGAGFAMSDTKFQPNSTGRIIVNDSKQAALLEYCEPETGETARQATAQGNA